MNVLEARAPFDATEIRRYIYDGYLVILEPTRSSQALCALARRLTEEAFAPLNPIDAQLNLPVERYVEILADVKPRFIHHLEAKAHIRGIFEEVGFELDRTYFDVPRLRSMTNREYLSSGIALSFHPHRDTWYSAPPQQINWWLPVYEMSVENGIAFHPEFWSAPIKNTSHVYNYEEWKRTSRGAAAQQIGKETRVQPEPQEPVDMAAAYKPVVEPGALILFSAAMLHSSIPNETQRTRFSIDFRTVDIEDVASFTGAPNIDSQCTGTTLRDYLRSDTNEHIAEEVVGPYEAGIAALEMAPRI